MVTKDSGGMGPDTDPSMMKELVDGFAHEVKNPLASIRSALKVLAERRAQGDPDRAVIEQIYDRVGRINRALSDLMDFALISPPEVLLTNIDKVLEQALCTISTECQRHKIKIETHLSNNLPEIKIDAKQIELAFLFIFSDMLKAMANGGKLLVRSSLDPEGRILVEIQDTGTSIPEIHMERLLKPFFATRGRGAGIGLATAKRIVDQNEGLIQVKSGGEEGLIFRIIFPLQIR
jgi:signal transduction histidine kinase